MKKVITSTNGPGSIIFEVSPKSVAISTVTGEGHRNIYIPNDQWGEVCNKVRDIENLLSRRKELAKVLDQLCCRYGVDDVIEALKDLGLDWPGGGGKAR